MYRHQCRNGDYLTRTAASWADFNDPTNKYLSTLNQKLIHQLNDTETQKYIYQNKLTRELHSHHDQLKESFKIISLKNQQILALRQEIQLANKDLRAAADDYMNLQRKYQTQKQQNANQIKRIQAQCQQKIKRIQEEADKRYQVRMRKRVQQVENQCEQRIKHFNSQIQMLTSNSRQVTHQLSLLQQQYRLQLVKNDTLAQQAIQRELRMRDFKARQHNLQGLAQKQTMKNQLRQISENLQRQINNNKNIQFQNKKIKATNQVLSQRIQDLQQTLKSTKQTLHLQMSKKKLDVSNSQTNTDKSFIPIAMPLDVNLAGEVASMREFLIEKLILRFLQFWQKATNGDKNSRSLITFKQHITEFKGKCQDLKILLFLQSNLQKIIQVYCPSLNNYSKDYLTIKDDFIRKTLYQCQNITDVNLMLLRMYKDYSDLLTQQIDQNTH